MTYVVSILLLSNLDAGIEQDHNHLILIVFTTITPQQVDITGNIYNILILLYFSSYSYAA